METKTETPVKTKPEVKPKAKSKSNGTTSEEAAVKAKTNVTAKTNGKTEKTAKPASVKAKEMTENQTKILTLIAKQPEVTMETVAKKLANGNKGTIASVLAPLFQRKVVAGYLNDDDSVSLVVLTSGLDKLSFITDDEMTAFPVYLNDAGLTFVGRPVIVDASTIVSKDIEKLSQDHKNRGSTIIRKTKNLSNRWRNPKRNIKGDGAMYFRSFSGAKRWSQEHNRSVLFLHEALKEKTSDAKMDDWKNRKKEIAFFVATSDHYQAGNLSKRDFSYPVTE